MIQSLGYLVSGVLGAALLLPLKSADGIWAAQDFLGMALIQIFFGGLVYTVGKFLCSALKLEANLGIALGIGSLGFAALSYASFLIPVSQILVFPLLAFGVTRSSPLNVRERWRIVVFFLFSLIAMLPQKNPDPLYYHLLSIRNWHWLGKYSFDIHQPLLYQTGLWENIYRFFLVFLPASLGSGLNEHLIFAQGLNIFVGGLGFFIVLESIMNRLRIAQPTIWAMAIFLNPIFLNIYFAAKSDIGSLLWGTTAIWLLLDKRHFWGGIFLGAAISNKWILFSSLPILFFWQYSKMSRSEFYRLSIGILWGIFPIAVRNLLSTGTPFFPLFAQQTLAPLDQKLFAEFTSVHGVSDWRSILERFLEIILAFPIFLGIFFIQKRRNVVCIISMVAFLILFLHPALDLRLYNFIWIWIALYVLANINRPPLFAYLTIALCLGQDIGRWHLPQNWQPAALIRSFSAGDAMAWIRANANPNAKVALSGNAELYYLEGFKAVNLDSSLDLGSKTLGLSNAEDLLNLLQQNDFDYLIETAGNRPRGIAAGILSQVSGILPQAIVFSGEFGRVWDIKKMADALSKPHPPLPIFKLEALTLPEQG